MVALRITGAGFWSALQPEMRSGGGVGHFNDGDLQYAAMPDVAQMLIIQRTAEEFFESTVSRNMTGGLRLRVAINGNFFDLTSSGALDVALGHDPVPAADTTVLGQVVVGKVVVAGSGASSHFWAGWADKPIPMLPDWLFGSGNPPGASLDAGLGGLGPLIVGGLPFGIGNLYSAGVPAGAPVTGTPGPVHMPFLTQRNNNTSASLAARGNGVGKVAIAIKRSEHTVLALVQPDGAATGISLDGLRNKLVAVGVEDAVFLDGSDSVMLNIAGTFHIHQGDNKNEATVIGVGFR